MAEAFLGEIRIFGGNFNPRQWALCDGQTMDISQYSALFSVIGINFGGDGRTTFMMPNLCGRTPLGTGSGPGLTPQRIGSVAGYEMANIDERNIPNHRHSIHVSKEAADLEAPDNASLLANATKKGKKKKKAIFAYAQAESPIHSMNPSMVKANQTATTVAHENRQPFLAMNFIICLDGLYPSRS